MMEEKLKFIFYNVNEWLKFAEAKLAGIIVFNTAIIIAIIQIITDFIKLSYLIRISLLIQVTTNVLSLVVSLWGVSPLVKKLKLKKGEISDKDNVFFWGDIFKYGADSYLKKLNELAGIANSYTELEKKLGNQIIINSKIAAKKYLLFRIALLTTLTGLITSLILLIIEVIT